MNLKSQSYAKGFFQHVAKFSREHGLWKPQQGLVVAISGGPDSTALCLFAKFLLEQNSVPSVRLLHINHGHRPGLADEEDFVRRLAAGLDLAITCFSVPAGELDPNSNFEADARAKRHFLLTENLLQQQKNEVLLSAHHLDDSFEWWLRQRLVSTHGNALGIPVINGLWRRPFLCVSKKQILTLLQKLEVPFLQDPTAKDLRYERNFLRSFLQTKKFHDRYPRALRHYVERSNQEAYALKKHVLSQSSEGKFYTEQTGGSFFVAITEHNPSVYSKLKEILKTEIPRLSESSRGNLVDQIHKIIQAMASHKKGPFDLSGGVKAYLFPNGIFLLSKTENQNWRQKDQALAQEIQNGSQIPELSLSNHAAYPKFTQSVRNSKSERFQAQLWSKTLKAALARGWRWKFHYQLRL